MTGPEILQQFVSLTPGQAAVVLNFSHRNGKPNRTRIYKFVDEGRLRPIVPTDTRIHLRFHRDEILRFLNEGNTP